MEAEGEKAPGHRACLTGQVTPWRTCRFWLDVALGLPRGPCLACGSQTGLYFPVTVYRGACSPVPFSRPRGERRPINQPIGFQTARPLAQLLRAAEGRWSWAPGPPAVGGSGQVQEAACGCSAGQRHTLRLLRAPGRGAVSASPTPAEARVWRMHRSAELHRADTGVRVAAALGAGRRRPHAAAAEGPGL